MGKVAGVRSGRADIAIEDLGTIVEIKFVRGPEDQRRIVEEYSNDLLLYTRWAPLKHLVFMVYNSQDLRDPEGLEKLGGPQNVNGVNFNVYMVLAQNANKWPQPSVRDVSHKRFSATRPRRRRSCC
jgi:hypothetical protein